MFGRRKDTIMKERNEQVIFDIKSTRSQKSYKRDNSGDRIHQLKGIETIEYR